MKVYISRGSVATQLRCGGIFNNRFTVNFLHSVTDIEFSKLFNIWRRCWPKLGGTFFHGPRCICTCTGVLLIYLYIYLYIDLPVDIQYIYTGKSVNQW